VRRLGLLFLPAVLLLAPFCQAADTIAVLPFFNQDEAKSPNLDWIGESVAETIHESLSSVGLLVLDREDREEVYRRLTLRTGVVLTRASVIKIGQSLDAGLVVFGEFHVEGAELGATSAKSNLKLTARVIDLKHLSSGPEFSQEGPLENLSQMQTKLAWMVAHLFSPEGTPGEQEFFRDRPPVKVEAVESYIRGLIVSNPDQKAKLFAQAVKLDDNYSAPNFQLGRMAFLKKDYKGAALWLAKVSKGDSHYLEAAFLRGICQYQAADFDGAVDLFRMVSAEVPLNEVFNNLGAALSRKNDSAATDNFSKALEGDQTDPDYWFNVGYSLWKRGQYALAAEKFRAVLDRSPGDQEATTMLGRCIKMDGPRAGDPRGDGRERIKTTFEDSAYRQLQAELRNKQSQ
jgi:tetratricopeptide (TPR) repeat protein